MDILLCLAVTIALLFMRLFWQSHIHHVEIENLKQKIIALEKDMEGGDAELTQALLETQRQQETAVMSEVRLQSEMWEIKRTTMHLLRSISENLDKKDR